MSTFNHSNAGYLPMANHGEFSNVPPSQAPFGYFNPGYEGAKNPSSYGSSLAPQQESTIMQQGEQLYGNAQQRDQYTIPPHFQQQSQETSYPLQYQRTALQPMSHGIVPFMQSSSTKSTSALNTHPTNMQSSWIQPELMHSQVNPNLSPTSQRYPSMLSFSASNLMPSYSQNITANSGHPSIGPPHSMGRYIGGIEMQGEAYSSTANIRQPQQSPQRAMQVSSSQGFVPTSPGPFMHMSQSFSQTQPSVNIAQGITNSSSPAAFNSQPNQSQRINQNMSQNKSSQGPQNLQLRYENVTPPMENRGQINYKRSFQTSSLKNNKPVSAQSVNTSHTLRTNLSNKDSHNTQQMPTTSSSSLKPVSNRQTHNTAFSQAFSVNLVNRPEDARQTLERRSSVSSVPMMNHGQLSEDQNKRYLSPRSRSVTDGLVADRDRGNSMASVMNRSEKVNAVPSDMSAPQRGSTRGTLSQGRGRGAATRATARGLSKKVATKTTGSKMPADQGQDSTSNDGRVNRQYCPIQWYKRPDAYQTDVEAMRADVNANVSASQNSNTKSNLHNSQVGPHIPKPGEKLTDSSGSASVYNCPPSFSSSHSPSTVTSPRVTHSESFPSKRTPNREDASMEVSSVRETASRIKGELREGVNSHSNTFTSIDTRPSPATTKLADSHKSSLSNACMSSSSQTQKNSSASTNSCSVPLNASPQGQDKGSASQRTLSGNEHPLLQETPHLKELLTSKRPATATAQDANASAAVSSASSHSSHKTTFNKGMLSKVKSEPFNGMSAREKVFSMWRAGQVVGRIPSKGKGKANSKEQASENSSSGNKGNSRVAMDVSQKPNQEAGKTNTKGTGQIAEKSNSQQGQTPFHALFHGHKIMCLKSKQGDLVLVCQFLHECFPDKGIGSVNNCINRALRIKKKPLEHVSKDKIISYLTNNGYLRGKGEGEPVFTISLNDAKRVYHFIYKIANCSSASCVVQHVNLAVDLDAVIAQSERKTLSRELMRRVKKEKKSAEDKNYGLMTKADVRKENEVDGVSSDGINNLSKASGRSAILADIEREEDDDESDSLIIVEGPEDPFFIKADLNQTKNGSICRTITGSVRRYHHKGETFLSVQDLCDILGYTEFMSVVERDNVDLFSCCNEILSFLNSMQPGFVRLTSGQKSLIREKDVGSYPCNEDSAGNNAILSAKRMNCKQEVIEDEAECTSCKQPRLENVADESNIMPTTSSSPLSNAPINLSTSSQSPALNISDREERLRLEPTDQNVEDPDKQSQENPDKQSQRRQQVSMESPDLHDENTNTILIIDASLVTDKPHSKLPLPPSEIESDELSNKITAAILRETVCSNTVTSLQDSGNALVAVPGNSSDTNVKSSANVCINASQEVPDVRLQSNAYPEHIERLKSDGNTNVQKLRTQQSKNVETVQTSNNQKSSVDSDTNTNVLTVIDNPCRSYPNVKALSGTNSTVLKPSLTAVSLSTKHSSQKDSVVTTEQNPLNISLIDLEDPGSSAGNPLQVLPSRLIDRRHTVPLETVSTKKDRASAESDIEMPVNSITLAHIDTAASHRLNKVNVLDSISTTMPDGSSYSNASTAVPAPSVDASRSDKAFSNFVQKQRSSSHDSIGSSSSFLQVASSPSFTINPKNAMSCVKYFADDLELLNPCHEFGEHNTKQALVKGMILLRYKNKALQDMVKHLRRELLNTKEKNENSAKLIKYYENVLHEITATFKEGEPEGEEAKELPKQQPQNPDTSGDSSTPILIDDD